jgi:hypothetical protein
MPPTISEGSGQHQAGLPRTQRRDDAQSRGVRIAAAVSEEEYGRADPDEHATGYESDRRYGRLSAGRIDVGLAVGDVVALG